MQANVQQKRQAPRSAFDFEVLSINYVIQRLLHDQFYLIVDYLESRIVSHLATTLFRAPDSEMGRPGPAPMVRCETRSPRS